MDQVAAAADNLPTNEFLGLAGAKLRRAGTALGVLDIDSDCYPLVLIPVAHTHELVDLAATAGYKAPLVTSSTY